MKIVEVNFRIDYNPEYADKRPQTKGSLWLWSVEKKYTNEGVEIASFGRHSEVARNLDFLKILVKNEFRPARLLLLLKAISMIENGETGVL